MKPFSSHTLQLCLTKLKPQFLVQWLTFPRDGESDSGGSWEKLGEEDANIPDTLAGIWPGLKVEHEIDGWEEGLSFVGGEIWAMGFRESFWEAEGAILIPKYALWIDWAAISAASEASNFQERDGERKIRGLTKFQVEPVKLWSGWTKSEFVGYVNITILKWVLICQQKIGSGNFCYFTKLY